jgi:hypothetical protein
MFMEPRLRELANNGPRAHQQVQLPIGLAPANTDLALRPLAFKLLPTPLASAQEHLHTVLRGEYEDMQGAQYNRTAYRVRKQLAEGKAGLVTKLRHWGKTGLRGEKAALEAQRYVETYTALEANHVARTDDPVVNRQMLAAGLERRNMIVNHDKCSLVGGLVRRDDIRLFPTQELQAQQLKTTNHFSELLDELTETVPDNGDGLTKVLNVDAAILKAQVNLVHGGKCQTNPKGHPINKEEASILLRAAESILPIDAVTGNKEDVTPDKRVPVPKVTNLLQNNILEAIKTEWRAPLDSFHPVSVSTGCNTMTDERGCQATSSSYQDRAKFIIPKRSDFKRFKAMRYIYADPELTNHLKCKYYMKRRDAATIQQMVSDARLYMLKAGRTMNTDDDYDTMTRAVMAAYFIDDAELEFRSRMKNQDNYDSLLHHNRTLEGDLGLVFSPFGQPGEKFGSKVKEATGLWKRMPLAPKKA